MLCFWKIVWDFNTDFLNSLSISLQSNLSLQGEEWKTPTEIFPCLLILASSFTQIQGTQKLTESPRLMVKLASIDMFLSLWKLNNYKSKRTRGVGNLKDKDLKKREFTYLKWIWLPPPGRHLRSKLRQN